MTGDAVPLMKRRHRYLNFFHQRFVARQFFADVGRQAMINAARFVHEERLLDN